VSFVEGRVCERAEQLVETRFLYLKANGTHAQLTVCQWAASETGEATGGDDYQSLTAS
jgi:hypothetical protein